MKLFFEQADFGEFLTPHQRGLAAGQDQDHDVPEEDDKFGILDILMSKLC
jgi:hypothetical protein